VPPFWRPIPRLFMYNAVTDASDVVDRPIGRAGLVGHLRYPIKVSCRCVVPPQATAVRSGNTRNRSRAGGLGGILVHLTQPLPWECKSTPASLAGIQHRDGGAAVVAR